MSNPVRLSRTASLDRNEIIEEVTSEGEVKKYMKGRLLGKVHSNHFQALFYLCIREGLPSASS
jgi:hypothetical protein